VLEDEAVRRAKHGTAKPVLYKGRQVYVDGEPLYEHQHSDSLLMFLLRAYDREKFGDRHVIEPKLEDWDGDLSKLKRTVDGDDALQYSRLLRLTRRAMDVVHQ